METYNIGVGGKVGRQFEDMSKMVVRVYYYEGMLQLVGPGKYDGKETLYDVVKVEREELDKCEEDIKEFIWRSIKEYLEV